MDEVRNFIIPGMDYRIHIGLVVLVTALDSAPSTLAVFGKLRAVTLQGHGSHSWWAHCSHHWLLLGVTTCFGGLCVLSGF